MAGCCGAIATGGTRLSASLVLVGGICIFIYGCVMLSQELNGFSIFVCSLGGYTMLVGCVGIGLSMMQTARCFTYLYVGLLSIAIVFESTAGVSLKADPDWAQNFLLGETCGALNSTMCGSQVQEAEDFFNKHTDAVFLAILGAVFLQLFSALFACCFKKTHAENGFSEIAQEPGLLEQGYYGGRMGEVGQSNYPNTPGYNSGNSSSGYENERMSESRAHANRLREKYGIPQQGSTRQSRSGYYSDNSERGM